MQTDSDLAASHWVPSHRSEPGRIEGVGVIVAIARVSHSADSLAIIEYLHFVGLKANIFSLGD